MQPASYYDVFSATLVANIVTVLLVFGIARMVKRDAWDWWSAGAILIAAAIALPPLYLAT